MRVVGMLGVALIILLFTAGCDSLPNFITGATIAECEALDTESLRDTCYAELGILRDDLNLCDKANDQGSKFYCYEGVASKTNTAAVCEDITDEYWRSTCFKNVGMAIDDASLCEEITTVESQNDCFYDVAVDTNAAQFCNNLVGDDPAIERCVSIIAADVRDLSVCGRLPTTFKQDRCGTRVAEAMGSPSTCNFLQLDVAKEICFKKAKKVADERRANATAINNSINQ